MLHPSGTCWVNLGDSYAGSGKGPTSGNAIGNPEDGNQEERQGVAGWGARMGSVHGEVGHTSGVTPPPGLKAKDLCLIPFRFALAMQQDGWWVRSDIAWCKTSAMPEAVTDRPTSAWEHVFLFTKSARYYYDGDAVRQRAARDWGDAGGSLLGHTGWATAAGRNDDTRNDGTNADTAGANLRNWWALSPEPLRAEHYAAYPTELVRRCLLAGSSERGVCAACSAPWQRVVERGELAGEARIQAGPRPAADERGISPTGLARTNGRTWRERVEIGWTPSCRCSAADPIPALTLDPFAGSGTTGLVALRHNRRFLGLDLNPTYVRMARQRIVADAPLFNAPVALASAADPAAQPALWSNE